MIDELFSAIDSKNVEKFVSLLADDCVFRFGNMPEVSGVNNISEFVGGFFSSIAALKHELYARWEVGNTEICHGMVSYTRLNGSVLTVPFCNVLTSNDTGICDYLIFADTSQLYA